MGFNFSESVDAGCGDGTHIAQAEPFTEQLDFILILGPHLLAGLPVTNLSSNLAAKAAVVIVPAFHARAYERAFHRVKLGKDAENQLSNRVGGSVGEQGFQPILMDVNTNSLFRKSLNDGKEVHRSAGKAAAFKNEHLIHVVSLNKVQKAQQRLPFLHLLGSTYLFGELFHNLIAHAAGIFTEFRKLMIIFLSLGAHSSVDASFNSFHVDRKN